MTEAKIANRNQQRVDDVGFILSECARILAMGVNVFKLLPKDEMFFSLPHPRGQGMMLCGRAAAQRLDALAEDARHAAGLSRRVELDAVRKPLAELIVARFIREKRPLDIAQVDRALAAAGTAARGKCQDNIHFVPCHLMSAKEPEVFAIGPVVFRNRAAFRRVLLERLREHEHGPEERREWSRRIMADAVIYYRTFDWVAEVSIAACDGSTSSLLTQRAVTSALDCLHLILRAQHTDKMPVGGPALRRDRRASLTVGVGGKLEPSGSYGWSGQGGFPDDWSAMLQRDDIKHAVVLCGLALETAIDPDLDRPLSCRFLDAAQWFGEASRDDHEATRVVKYVTALERMVMTDEKDDITLLVSERVAAICCERGNAIDRNQWREKTRLSYALR